MGDVHAAVLLEKLQQFKFEGTAAALMSTLAETLGRASRYSSELQRATLSTRMQPVGRLFQKFPRLVRELAKGGMTVLWSTAYLDEAELCDHVLLMADGEVRTSGTLPYMP